MRLGIIGRAGAGKTTLFNALTGSDLPVGIPGPVQVHSAAVDIPDPRLQALSDLYQPRKTTHAKATISDLGGLEGAADLSGPLLDQLAQVEALLLVLKGFEDPQSPGQPDPQADLAALEGEFLLRDLLRVEHRQARLVEERQKGARERAAIERDADLLQRLADSLNQDRPLRDLALTAEEERLLGGLGLLSRKPLLAVVNCGDDRPEWPLETTLPQLSVRGKLEMEIAQLPPEEQAEFSRDYGIAEPALVRTLRLAQAVMKRITFFTVSEPEVRAWLLPDGGTALEAAGLIHTDLARGFIRAEIIPWQELVELGDLAAARAQGRLRVEGKQHALAEGDVIYVRFHV
jgi:ribosome-binding ATPase YchF (GTP1/OBG family)